MTLKNKKLMIVAIAAFLAIVLAVMTIVLFIPTKKKIVGTWEGKWKYDGNSFMETLILRENDTWSSVTYKNGELYKMEFGEYSIDGLKVHLTRIDVPIHTFYNYLFGKLHNGRTWLSKS